MRRTTMMSALVLLLAVAGSAQLVVADSGHYDAGVQWLRPSGGPAPTQSLSSRSGRFAAGPGYTRYSTAHDVDLSHDSMEVVRGLVEAFMHKVELTPGEKRCLKNNIGTFAGDIMGTVQDVVTATKALVPGKGGVAGDQRAPVVTAVVDGATKLISLLTVSTNVLKNCVHGDALEMMRKTGQHMINGTYLEHRILVNGVDIAQSLSDSVLAFEAHHFHRFGSDIGICLRKILLSKATHGSALPEGVPDQVIIQQATEGLMHGFFARGSSLQVTDTANPHVDIVVNLHRCIAGNSMFFKEMWMASWDLFAQISVNKEQHGLGFQQNQQKGQAKWQGELMVAMMQMPMALSKCGVNQDMQHMFMEAIKSLQGVNVNLNIPHHRISGSEATERMAKAVQAWTRWDFERFGYELGKLFRELVMLAFPEKYSVDASGRLQLSGSSSQAQVTSSTVIAGGVVASFAAAFFVVRVRRLRSQPRTNAEAPSLLDVEGGDMEVE